MVWAIDMDDFHGTCGRKNALLKVLHENMKSYKVPEPLPTTPRPVPSWSSPWNPPSNFSLGTTPGTGYDQVTNQPTMLTSSSPQPSSSTVISSSSRPPSSTMMSSSTVTSPVTDSQPSSSTAAPSSSSTTTQTSDGAQVPSSCSEGEYFKHPNCRNYYWCVHGQYMVMSCKEGLVFDYEEQTCNWPEAVPNKSHCKMW